MTHSLNSHGELMDPYFHDGLLTGISLIDGGATLSMRTVDGARYEMNLVGVTCLHANDLRESNIIDTLEMIAGPDVDPQHLRPLFWGDLPGEAVAESLKRGETMLINLTTSYGCELMALCRDFSVNPIQAIQAPIR